MEEIIFYYEGLLQRIYATRSIDGEVMSDGETLDSIYQMIEKAVDKRESFLNLID